MKLEKYKAIFSERDLRRKVLFILFAFAIFRIVSSIPLPGINKLALKKLQMAGGLFGLLNLFTGGALENVSLALLGLGPYITAIIIMQLLTFVFPRLKEMYEEEGEKGRERFVQYARILTLPIAFIQGMGMIFHLQTTYKIFSPSFSTFDYILAGVSVAASSLFLMWLGELISEKGIGDGISLLILAGIIARFPYSLTAFLFKFELPLLTNLLAFLLIAFIILYLVIMINEARRNVPISYAKQIRGRKMFGGVKTYLPIMVNPAGVIPIIFAIAVLLLPSNLGRILTLAKNSILVKIGDYLSAFPQNEIIYMILYFALVVIFTYFYTAVTFQPDTIANNLQKIGAFIPGIRPGKETADFIKKILNRVVLVGAIFLGFVAITPHIVQKVTQIREFNFIVGGTSILIIVSVILETIKRIDSILAMKEYE